MTTRIEPDRAALEIIHRKLRFPIPLDEMLKDYRLKIIMENAARPHMRRQIQFDAKAAVANNND